MKRPLAMVALLTAIVMMGWLVWHDPGPDKKGSGKAAEVSALGGLIQGKEVTLTGRVYDVEQRENYGASQLWIYLDSITIQQQDASVKEAVVSYHLICQTDSEYRPRLGSRIQVTGQFEKFSHATNPGQFDAQKYYATMNVGGMLKKTIITASGNRYSFVKEGLYCLREYWKGRLYQGFPKKEASVLSAMILGDRTGLDEETKEHYMQNGIIHILSISGLHITLIGMGLYRLLRRCRCPVVLAAVVGGLTLFLYGVMTGMGISAIRAIGMYLIRMLGELLGRTYDMMTALGCLYLLMIAARPAYLTNAGFLLSFGSLCGIGVILPRMEVEKESTRRRFDRKSGQKMVREMAGIAGNYIKKAALPGIAVTLVTLPILLYYYYEVPVYSVILNLLVLPFLGIVMVVGLIVMIVPGMFWVGRLNTMILSGFEWLCEMFEKLPNHTWNPGAPQVWQIITYYLLLIWGIFGILPVKKKQILRVTMILSAVLLLGWRFQPQLSVTFLDVGQGDGICVRTRKETYLFDCGSSNENKVGEYILLPYLKHEGIRHLDGVFLSHSDKDHISGILELLTFSKGQGITIERLILPELTEERMKSEFAGLFEVLDEMGEEKPKVLTMSRGSSWQSAEVIFTCLHPPADCNLSESNAYSQCFFVESERFSMLLTADVEGEGEELLMQEMEELGIGQVDLLKVAHHGSRYSTTEAFLSGIKPDIAVISCGSDNPYGHPHKEILQKLDEVGSKLLTTPQYGAITVKIGREVKVYGYKR